MKVENMDKVTGLQSDLEIINEEINIAKKSNSMSLSVDSGQRGQKYIEFYSNTDSELPLVNQAREIALKLLNSRRDWILKKIEEL